MQVDTSSSVFGLHGYTTPSLWGLSFYSCFQPALESSFAKYSNKRLPSYKPHNLSCRDLWSIHKDNEKECNPENRCPQWHIYPPFLAHSATQVCTGIRQNPFFFKTGRTICSRQGDFTTSLRPHPHSNPCTTLQ